MPEPALSELARKCKRHREPGQLVSAFFPKKKSKPKRNPDPRASTNPEVNTESKANASHNLDSHLDPSSQVSVAGSSRFRRLGGHEVAALLRQFHREEDESNLSWEDLI